MTVAVAYQASPTSRGALQQAVREAKIRETELAVLHAVSSAMDPDKEESYRLGISDEIERVVGPDPGVKWELHLSIAGTHLAEQLMTLADEAGAELLVIGARRRSPVGKALMGSVAQTMILEADVPVLVVKPPA